MKLLLLIPGCLSLFLVLRGRVKTAFLSVYLPSLLLIPQEYDLRLPHLPMFSAAEYALMPIGVVALIRHFQNRSFRPMDALVFLFGVSWCASEILGEPVTNDGILAVAGFFVTPFLPYVIGRQLIEPELRFETVRRWVIFVLLLAPIGIYEWRFGVKVYGVLAQKLDISSMSPSVAVRDGRGRLSVSLGGGELTGIAIAVTFALNVWLASINKLRARLDFGKWFARLERYHAPGLLLLLCLYMTQSRGPMIAMAAGYLIIQIAKFKKTKLATGVVAMLLVLAGLGAKQYFDRYTAGTVNYEDEQRASAQYRREMNTVYQSVAEMGGWFGWSAGAVPVLGGQKSIDNHFLLVHLMQGEFGYILLILIAAESVRNGVACVWSFRALHDRAFACSMLAIFAIFWISYYTVFMGGPLPQITFLMLGWGQSLVPFKAETASVAELQSRSRFGFQRIFT